jgi:hypothetical protein
MRQTALIASHVQAQNFPGLALDRHFKRPAANLAIRRESLRRDAGIHADFKRLPAERALNRFGNFHGHTLMPNAELGK